MTSVVSIKRRWPLWPSRWQKLLSRATPLLLSTPVTISTTAESPAPLTNKWLMISPMSTVQNRFKCLGTLFLGTTNMDITLRPSASYQRFSTTGSWIAGTTPSVSPLVAVNTFPLSSWILHHACQRTAVTMSPSGILADLSSLPVIQLQRGHANSTRTSWHRIALLNLNGSHKSSAKYPRRIGSSLSATIQQMKWMWRILSPQWPSTALICTLMVTLICWTNTPSMVLEHMSPAVLVQWLQLQIRTSRRIIWEAPVYKRCGSRRLPDSPSTAFPLILRSWKQNSWTTREKCSTNFQWSVAQHHPLHLRRRDLARSLAVGGLIPVTVASAMIFANNMEIAVQISALHAVGRAVPASLTAVVGSIQATAANAILTANNMETAAPTLIPFVAAWSRPSCRRRVGGWNRRFCRIHGLQMFYMIQFWELRHCEHLVRVADKRVPTAQHALVPQASWCPDHLQRTDSNSAGLLESPGRSMFDQEVPTIDRQVSPSAQEFLVNSTWMCLRPFGVNITLRAQ